MLLFMSTAVIYDLTSEKDFVDKCTVKGGNPAVARGFRLCIDKNAIILDIN